MSTLIKIAQAGLDANPAVVERVVAAGPQAQYKAVSVALAKAIARKADCTVNQATWAVVNIVKSSLEDDEEINDF